MRKPLRERLRDKDRQFFSLSLLLQDIRPTPPSAPLLRLMGALLADAEEQQRKDARHAQLKKISSRRSGINPYYLDKLPSADEMWG